VSEDHVSQLLPNVTVIMPVRNESDFITRSLGAVLEQDYPHEQIEVLVADGMSTDATRAVIAQLATTTIIPIRVIDNPRQIVPTGFNAALREAHGEIIVRVDGHTIIAPDYLRQCVTLLLRSVADNVGGKMTAESANEFGKAVAAATSTPFGVGGSRFHYSDIEEYVDTVYMGAWRREVFDRFGAFDEDLVRNQDDEFNYRLRANGGRILLSPAIKSIYYNRSSFRTLWKQYYQYGLYKVRVMQKHPLQMRPRQFVPAALVAVIIGGGLVSLLFKPLRLLWGLSLAAYVVANLLASVLTTRQVGRRYLKYLPLVFATLHFSYGAGFWHGLVKFRKSWNNHVQ
jgi:succinoglycan biosynthesis protein ExoA